METAAKKFRFLQQLECFKVAFTQTWKKVKIVRPTEKFKSPQIKDGRERLQKINKIRI